ncbi:MAG: hypothetical protein PHE29_01640 [Tissierellia bacterium]|nr:hypothetical protein [Tissierellia bacterium]MDD4780203.1 hypothetical protein [Tissierellia bacterium]
MKDLFAKVKNIPASVKTIEIMYLVIIIIYLYMQSGEGLATTFYSFLAVVITSAISSIYFLFFKKYNALAIINLLIAAVIFIQLASKS